MTEGLGAIFAIGAVISFSGALNLLKCFNRRRWPETTGTIQQNGTTETLPENYGPFSKITGMSFAGSVKDMELRLSYVYLIENYKYLGRQLFSAPVFKARNAIAGLHEGDRVKVFYKPNSPAVSFLAHSFAWPSILVITIGLGILAAASYVHFNL